MDYTPSATDEDGHGRSNTADKGDGEHGAGYGPAPVADGIEMGATKLASETVDDSPDQPIKVNGVWRECATSPYLFHSCLEYNIL